MKPFQSIVKYSAFSALAFSNPLYAIERPTPAAQPEEKVAEAKPAQDAEAIPMPEINAQKTAFLGVFGEPISDTLSSQLNLAQGIGLNLKLVAGNTSFPDPLGIGEPASLVLTVFGEFIAPIFILIGLKTRFAAIPPAIAMGVAVFIMHGADPFSKQEHAFMYFAAFIAISLMGAGKFSVDGLLNKR